jgi:(p)ppGpp synthase/HD superfamily hydrolase
VTTECLLPAWLAIMNDAVVPLSKRSLSELRAKANEMRQMAQTATTAEVRAALLKLADRYDAMVTKREKQATP